MNSNSRCGHDGFNFIVAEEVNESPSGEKPATVVQLLIADRNRAGIITRVGSEPEHQSEVHANGPSEEQRWHGSAN